MQIVMPLQDGDAVAFAMPGYEGALYSFARSGKAISISVEVEQNKVASAN